MWSSTSVCSAIIGFFCATDTDNGSSRRGHIPLEQPKVRKAEQIAEVAKSFEQERAPATGPNR